MTFLQAALSPGKVHPGGGGVQNGSPLHHPASPEPDLPDAAGGDEALIGIVVHIGDAVLRPDDMAVTGVIDHDVGVTAGGKDALPGVEPV